MYTKYIAFCIFIVALPGHSGNSMFGYCDSSTRFEDFIMDIIKSIDLHGTDIGVYRPPIRGRVTMAMHQPPFMPVSLLPSAAVITPPIGRVFHPFRKLPAKHIFVELHTALRISGMYFEMYDSVAHDLCLLLYSIKTV